MSLQVINMFRRPMMYITSVFAAAIIITYYYGAVLALAFTGMIALFLFVSRSFIENKTVALIIMISMLSGIICFVFHDSEVSAFEEHINEKVAAVVKITDIKTKNTVGIDGEPSEYVQMEARVLSINGADRIHKEKILINHYDNTVDGCLIPGKYVCVSGIVKEPDGRRNPGCFDYSLYLKSVGIRYVMTADQIDTYEYIKSLPLTETLTAKAYSEIYLMRETFLGKIEVYAGTETAGLIRAIMFGDTAEVYEDTLEEFRRNGTAHVLAVSGLHIGIIYGFISLLWRWKKGRMYFAAVMIFFLAYMMMASFSPSVVRAVIMVWIHVFAQLSNKRYDMASAAFFTALMMLIYEPMSVFNVGFQMSFLAVLTLSLILPIIKKFYSGIFLASIAVQVGLTPYTIYVFNYISIIAVLVNVPVIFLVGIIVPAGMCCMIFMFIFEPLGGLAAQVLGGLCIILEKLNAFTCVEGITVFDVKSSGVWVIAAYYLILLVFVSEDGRIMAMRKKKVHIRSMACLVMTAVLIFSNAAGNHFKNSDIVFVDVGQGDCIHIRIDRGVLSRNDNYLIDGGGSISYEVGKKTLKPYLLKNGTRKIDAAFVTHLHTDHYKGIAELCREDMVNKLYVYEGYSVREAEILADTGLSKEQLTYVHAGQKIILGRDAFAEILWPEPANYREYEQMAADVTDENSLCLIVKVTVKNKSMLVTGDVDSACLDHLAARYGETLHTDILKAVHHGSKYSDSEAFAEAAKPEYVVFQVGKNNFGHPNEGVIENFRQKGIMIYRNDTDGAVAFDIKNSGKVRVRTVEGE